MHGGGYPLGSLVRITGAFADADGTAVDPTTVYVKVKNPAGTISTYAEPSVVNDAVGSYYYDVDAAAVGTWEYRWYSTGIGQAADEDHFVVEHSGFE